MGPSLGHGPPIENHYFEHKCFSDNLVIFAFQMTIASVIQGVHKVSLQFKKIVTK